ncbi:MAG: hypothetical protein CVU87_06280 [Firmicutes bacterium HGW-Firmicutes-12]|nr:MAG: hypothetical protein CVU87_06280 [Firmicutes bacterium HGW-Firmicutes-12]
MTMPNFPEVPDIDICESLGLVIESVALEELALAHLINAEAEKVQKIADPENCATPFEMIKINDSVSKSLVNIIKLQMLLQFKLENVLDKLPDLCDDDHGCHPPHHKKRKSE